MLLFVLLYTSIFKEFVPLFLAMVLVTLQYLLITLDYKIMLCLSSQCCINSVLLLAQNVAPIILKLSMMLPSMYIKDYHRTLGIRRGGILSNHCCRRKPRDR